MTKTPEKLHAWYSPSADIQSGHSIATHCETGKKVKATCFFNENKSMEYMRDFYRWDDKVYLGLVVSPVRIETKPYLLSCHRQN